MIWVGAETHREELLDRKGSMGCSEEAAWRNDPLDRQERAWEV